MNENTEKRQRKEEMLGKNSVLPMAYFTLCLFQWHVCAEPGFVSLMEKCLVDNLSNWMSDFRVLHLEEKKQEAKNVCLDIVRTQCATGEVEAPWGRQDRDGGTVFSWWGPVLPTPVWKLDYKQHVGTWATETMRERNFPICLSWHNGFAPPLLELMCPRRRKREKMRGFGHYVLVKS